MFITTYRLCVPLSDQAVFYSSKLKHNVIYMPARAIESNTLNEFKGYVDNYLRKYSEDYTSQRVGGSLPRQSPSF